MARSIRIEFSGASYHVMARGNRRQGIFVDDDDRRFFLQCLGEVCEKTGWRVHAWVLICRADAQDVGCTRKSETLAGV